MKKSQTLNEYIPELKKKFKFLNYMGLGAKFTYDKKEDDILVSFKSSVIGLAVFGEIIDFCKSNNLYFIIDRRLEITIYK